MMFPIVKESSLYVSKSPCFKSQSMIPMWVFPKELGLEELMLWVFPRELGLGELMFGLKLSI